MRILIEIEKEKCKEAIYILLKGKWKVQLRYNNDDEEDDEWVMERRNGWEKSRVIHLFLWYIIKLFCE